MRTLRVIAILTLLAGPGAAQENSKPPAAVQAKDLLTMVRADHSLCLFDSALRSSGIAKIINGEGPFTVFALSNQAFANLPAEDLRTLVASPSAMYVLLAHYVIRGAVVKDDTVSMLSSKTLGGGNLRTDLRSEGIFVNGAKLNQPELRTTNGSIWVLDSFDPGLVHDAVALAKAIRRKK
jgi:uncharacterized surface protein with fasciclin (FAS1) repeats